MNRYQAIGVILLTTGIIFLILSGIDGKSKVGVFFIFPYFYGTGVYALIGVLCVMFGLIIFVFGKFESFFEIDEDLEKEIYLKYPKVDKKIVDKKIKGGGVIFIGPIPIIFGSDAKTTIIIIVLALILTALGFIIWKSY